MVRTQLSINASVSSNTAGHKDLGNVNVSVLIDSLNEGGSQKFLLPAATTDKLITLDDLAECRMIFVKTQPRDPNQVPVSIDLKRNADTAEPITITPLATKTAGVFLLSTEGLTSIYLTNAGTVDMDITMLVVGD